MKNSKCWRAHPLIKGKIYSVLQDYNSLNHRFIENEKVTFRECKYSSYDSMSLFTFEKAMVS